MGLICQRIDFSNEAIVLSASFANNTLLFQCWTSCMSIGWVRLRSDQPNKHLLTSGWLDRRLWWAKTRRDWRSRASIPSVVLCDKLVFNANNFRRLWSYFYLTLGLTSDNPSNLKIPTHHVKNKSTVSFLELKPATVTPPENGSNIVELGAKYRQQEKGSRLSLQDGVLERIKMANFRIAKEVRHQTSKSREWLLKVRN